MIKCATVSPYLKLYNQYNIVFPVTSKDSEFPSDVEAVIDIIALYNPWLTLVVSVLFCIVNMFNHHRKARYKQNHMWSISLQFYSFDCTWSPQESLPK